MKAFETVFIILGAAFIGIGGMVGTVFAFAFAGEPGGLGFLAIPFFFVVLGACFIGAILASRYKSNLILKKGKKYPAKIYGYVKNTSYTVNGEFTSNTKVHYFDENGIEREAILNTGFSAGSSHYPIGMTIDIYELDGKYNYDPKSVRDEILDREAELMDDKPIDPTKLKVVAIKCNNCGASFEAASGYSNKCPYCGGFINA